MSPAGHFSQSGSVGDYEILLLVELFPADQMGDT